MSDDRAYLSRPLLVGVMAIIGIAGLVTALTTFQDYLTSPAIRRIDALERDADEQHVHIEGLEHEIGVVEKDARERTLRDRKAFQAFKDDGGPKLTRLQAQLEHLTKEVEELKQLHPRQGGSE